MHDCNMTIKGCSIYCVIIDNIYIYIYSSEFVHLLRQQLIQCSTGARPHQFTRVLDEAWKSSFDEWFFPLIGSDERFQAMFAIIKKTVLPSPQPRMFFFRDLF